MKRYKNIIEYAQLKVSHYINLDSGLIKDIHANFHFLP